jgi:hypothetical protein
LPRGNPHFASVIAHQIKRQSTEDFRQYARRRNRAYWWDERLSATKQIGEKTGATRKV